MITYSILAIHLCLFIVGLLKKNSKAVALIQLLWMYFLAAGDTASADWVINDNIYNDADTESWIIYNILCAYGKSFGLDFLEFNAIMLIPVFIILWKIIVSNTKNCAFVISLILLYPFVDIVTQKRWFFATIIALLGLLAIIKQYKHNKIIFLIAIIIASLIHEGALLYLIFLLTDVFLKTKRKFACFSMIMIAMCIFSALAPQIAGMIPLVGEERVEFYFEILHNKMNYPILTFIAFSGMHIMMVFCVYVFYKIMIKDKSYNILRLNDSRLLTVNIISLFIVPLYYWEPTFFRMYRNILLLNYIFISSYLPEGNIYKFSLIKKLLMFFLCFLLVFVFMSFVVYASVEGIILPIFTKNILIN